MTRIPPENNGLKERRKEQLGNTRQRGLEEKIIDNSKAFFDV